MSMARIGGVATALRQLFVDLFTHPLGRMNKRQTLIRFVRWQIASRTMAEAIAVPFTDGTRLLLKSGMRGVTMNYYVGLHEFEDMLFVMHLLRETDQFVDVGANVGEYSILAAGRGARVLAIEPAPETYKQLLDNVSLNRFHLAIETRRTGVGAERGELRLSARSGPTNHVLSDAEPEDQGVVVPVDQLDAIAAGCAPMVIKIDVEGFEANVIQGAQKVLSEQSLSAVLIELNGLGARYGFDDRDIHDALLRHGFRAARYDPHRRRLSYVSEPRKVGNTLYVRPSPLVDARLQSASPFVFGHVRI